MSSFKARDLECTSPGFYELMRSSLEVYLKVVATMKDEIQVLLFSGTYLKVFGVILSTQL